MELIDSHAHLEYAQFNEDRRAMLERARQAGVVGIAAIGSGSGAEGLESALPFAEAYDWIWATIGIHPNEAHEATERHFEKLAEMAKHPRVIAWGEIGLDYHYENTQAETQQKVFRRQLEMARSARLPVILHCREAWNDALTIFEGDWAPSGLGGIFHCFTGTLEEARRGMEMGFLISFAGNVTYPKSEPLRQVARQLPLEKILIETDSPFLPPQGRRGKRNEPAFVVEVAKTLANVRNLSTEEIGHITASNFRRFFRLDADRTARPTTEGSPSPS